MNKALPFLFGENLFSHDKKTSGGSLRQQWRKALEEAMMKTSRADVGQYHRALEQNVMIKTEQRFAQRITVDVQSRMQQMEMASGSKVFEPNANRNGYDGFLLQLQRRISTAYLDVSASIAGANLNKAPVAKVVNEIQVRDIANNYLQQQFSERFPILRHAVLLKQEGGWHLVIRDADPVNFEIIKKDIPRILSFFARAAIKINKMTLNGEMVLLFGQDSGEQKKIKFKGSDCSIDKAY